MSCDSSSVVVVVDTWQVLAVNEEGLQRCHEATVARGHPVTLVSCSLTLTYIHF